MPKKNRILQIHAGFFQDVFFKKFIYKVINFDHKLQKSCFLFKDFYNSRS